MFDVAHPQTSHPTRHVLAASVCPFGQRPGAVSVLAATRRIYPVVEHMCECALGSDAAMVGHM
ncbi:hypothetical protein RW1_097_01260 [Rhodococcus wratislaviensis NBRC 100605]|uniref:Uncharacterized protein n=1 Tax=Rhodococcus wratislaviensis NBRC 100605 TaxID=1219028 RepID=X0QI72_RHOWR|nr:hypothetical protein RW1_097_01260 [Rhodococcus wratislaviensis NBRC 100605]